MKLSERVLAKEKEIARHVKQPALRNFGPNTEYAYEERYAGLPMWERTARTVAYGLENLPVDILDSDVLIGRYRSKCYDPNSSPDDHPRPLIYEESSFLSLAQEATFAEIMGCCPEVRTDFLACGLHGDAFWAGHECHSFQTVLHLGWQGLREQARRMLARTRDEKSREFYQGVIITLDALIKWNDRHVDELKRRGMAEQAEVCARVPQYPARTFREAVQSISMVYFTVTIEGGGTYGPGWVDYYLWPYLERDLKAGRITQQEAFDLCGEMLVHMNSRVLLAEEHNDTICLGGSHPNGVCAVNPLTYMIAEASLQLDITCLLVYLKMPEDPPEEYVAFAARYLMEGRNRGQVLNDKAIASALEYRGAPYHEALSYTTNGCMEISCSQANSDLLLCGWHNIPKFVEFSLTGNRCLLEGKTYDTVHYAGLASFDGFEDFYGDFLAETRRLLHMYFGCVDIFSKHSETYRPMYYCSSLMNDCMLRGRTMHGGGTRYHDYGTAPVGMANAADCLYAVKRAVFEERLCTAQELLLALEENFEGHEALRLRLRAIPKYGQDDDVADAFARRFFDDICDIYESYENRLGGMVKPVVFTFVWAGVCAEHLGAMADGSFAHTFASQGTTPASTAMTNTVTAAILSNCKMPMHRFTGGGSSMWDFNADWVNPEVLEPLLKAFLALGGQMFQGNTSADPKELLKAQQNPGDYAHLLVRVGGFSAHFIDLDTSVQNDIIARMQRAHNA